VAADGSLVHAATIDAEKLYANQCARCHGDTGRGDGPTHTMQRPWPRDFTTGQYKYRSTPLYTLPLKSDVERTIAKGVLRTSMPPYENHLSKEEISALADYVLGMSKHSGVPSGAAEAPAAARDLDALVPDALMRERGRALYEKNRCATCHGSNGRGFGELTGGLRDANGFWVAPADLTDPDAYGGGAAASDIHMRLKTGIALSPMPDYSAVLTHDETRALALYVKSLQKPIGERRLIDPKEWHAVLPAATRGEYLTRAMSCALCHNHYDRKGMYNPDAYMAGGVGITLPGLGVFPTRNITSDKETGIGDWTEEEIIRAMTTGFARDRRLEAFAMPWVFFSHLEEQDARDIAVYLKSLTPIYNAVPDREFYPIWKRLWQRFKQLIGLEHGRLEYPAHNKGRRSR